VALQGLGDGLFTLQCATVQKLTVCKHALTRTFIHMQQSCMVLVLFRMHVCTCDRTAISSIHTSQPAGAWSGRPRPARRPCGRTWQSSFRFRRCDSLKLIPCSPKYLFGFNNAFNVRSHKRWKTHEQITTHYLHTPTQPRFGTYSH